jgi:hypothetical protein
MKDAGERVSGDVMSRESSSGRTVKDEQPLSGMAGENIVVDSFSGAADA